MDNPALWVAIANVLIAVTRLLTAIRARRVVALIWFLIAYFSVFFIPVVLRGPFLHRQGFTNNLIEITASDIERTVDFVLLFNLAFLATELLLWLLIGKNNRQKDWHLPKSSPMLDRISLALLGYLLLGTVLYGITSHQQQYRDYVEFQGSNWGLVFLWAGAPLIALLALRQRYLFAVLASVPFLYFAFHLKIRAFALLSIIPIAIILVLQIIHGSRASRLKKTKLVIYAAVIGAFLLGSSVLILQLKAGSSTARFSLPDSGMPFGTTIIMKSADHYQTRTEWDALALYGRNLINPFIKLGNKLFSAKEQEIVDPPVVMARLYDGVPKYWDVYYHYPALWYLDAFVAFGQYGLLLGVLWGVVIVAWEKLLTRNNVLLGLLLPFFTWHIYMLVRGATAGASAPMAYALYLTLIPALLIGKLRIFYSDRRARKIKPSASAAASALNPASPQDSRAL